MVTGTYRTESVTSIRQRSGHAPLDYAVDALVVADNGDSLPGRSEDVASFLPEQMRLLQEAKALFDLRPWEGAFVHYLGLGGPTPRNTQYPYEGFNTALGFHRSLQMRTDID